MTSSLDVPLLWFVDADYAGDKTNSWSTSGVFIAIVGPRTYVPIVAVSKKQTCTSHSTCEAEVVAFNTGLKAALPIMDLWEAIMPYFSPAKAGAVSPAKPGASTYSIKDLDAKIDPGSFAGGVPPDSSRLKGLMICWTRPPPGNFRTICTCLKTTPRLFVSLRRVPATS